MEFLCSTLNNCGSLSWKRGTVVLDVYNEWQHLPKFTEREVERDISIEEWLGVAAKLNATLTAVHARRLEAIVTLDAIDQIIIARIMSSNIS